MLIQRRTTIQVTVGNIGIGSDYPIVIQSMTNTPTADIDATIVQIKELVSAGSELVRLTINDSNAATAAIEICKQLKADNITTPIVGDFHFNGHLLLSENPEMAQALAKYRINPGNLGRGQKHDEHFGDIIKIANEYNKPIRIGVNSGSLDPELLAEMMDKNSKLSSPESSQIIFCDAMVESALQSAQQAIKLELPEDAIILSAKTSNLQDLVYINRTLAQRSPFPLHLGLTEAGSAEQGIVASAAAIGILLQQGIGDTIRVSLTPDKNTPRSKEVKVCQHILQSLDMRFFQPKVISCPGCGRTSSEFFQKSANSVKIYIDQHLPDWRKKYPGVEQLTVAVMGCVVNGPGESRHADIGISLPGHAEEPAAPVYIHGKHFKTLRGENIEQQFLKMLTEFLKNNY